MTLLEEAILEVYRTEQEKSDDPDTVPYPFDDGYTLAQASSGKYLNTAPV